MTPTLVSLSVDLNDEAALNRASLFFSGLALDASKLDTITAPPIVSSTTVPSTTVPSTANDTGVKLTPVVTPVTSDVNETIVDDGLDNDGIQWDERIHSSAKSKTAKGIWKIARNKDKALVKTVLAELAGTVSSDTSTPPVVESLTPTPPSIVVPPTPPSIVVPVPEPLEPEYDTYYIYNGNNYTAEQLSESGWTADQMDGLETIDVMVDSSNVTEITFPEFLAKATEAMNAGTLEKSQVDLACQKHGVMEMALLVSSPDKIPAIYNELFN